MCCPRRLWGRPLAFYFTPRKVWLLVEQDAEAWFEEASSRSKKEMGKDRTELFLGIPMKWVSLILLVLQTVGVVFAMRISRVGDGPKYLNTTAVFFSELLKLLGSFVLLVRERTGVGRAAMVVMNTMLGRPRETLKMLVPSLLYTLQNNLLFICLSNLSGAVYQVSYQLKILSTALLSVAILGKSLDGSKWFSLVLLTVGVALIQFPKSEGANEGPREGNTFVGMVAVLSACMTSGLAGVYLEMMLKQTDASVWMRNIQLGFFGSLMAFGGAFWQEGAEIAEGGFLQGYTSLVWCVILLQAFGGLIVAAVLKYADNILKCFGNALSIVVSCMLSAVFLKEFEPDLLFVLGTILVLAATVMYSLGGPRTLWALLHASPP